MSPPPGSWLTQKNAGSDRVKTKGVFFPERANSFFKSPNLQNKNIPKNYPELEI